MVVVYVVGAVQNKVQDKPKTLPSPSEPIKRPYALTTYTTYVGIGPLLWISRICDAVVRIDSQCGPPDRHKMLWYSAESTFRREGIPDRNKIRFISTIAGLTPLHLSLSGNGEGLAELKFSKAAA